METQIKKVEKLYLEEKKIQNLIKEKFSSRYKLIDLGSAASMNIFEDIIKKDFFTKYSIKAVKKLTAYPSLESDKLSLEKTIKNFLKKKFNISINLEKIIVFGGTYGSYKTIILNSKKKKIILPNLMHQTHKACFSLMNKNIIEIPVKQNGLLNIKKIEENLKRYHKDIDFIYINHSLGPKLSKRYFLDIAKLLEKYNLYCIYDADVFFTSYDDTDPLIPLKVDSFSKRTIFLFTMTKELGSPGLRISWGIGPKKLIQKLKNFQKISLEILPPPNKFLVEKILKNVNVERVKKILKERMEILVKGIKKLGWKIEKPSFGVNLFIPVPLNFKKLKRTNPDSVFSYYLAKKTKILVRTGSSHGNKKYDTVRFVISQKKEIIKEAIERMKKENISYNMYLPKEIEEEFINEIITCK